MNVLQSIKQLSTEGLINILSNHSHVNVDSCEGREELEEVLQININEYLIDEIEVLLELSGE